MCLVKPKLSFRITKNTTFNSEQLKELRVYRNAMRAYKKAIKAEKFKRTMHLLKSNKHRELNKYNEMLKTQDLLCMDLEFYKGKKKLNSILEVGISIWRHTTQTIETYSFLPQETLHLENTHLGSNKFNSNFTKHQIMTLDEIINKVNLLKKDIPNIGGHSFKNDKWFFTKQNVHIDTAFDTQTLAKFYFTTNQQLGLQTILEKLGMEFEHLHNASNDSYYTLKALIKMTRIES